MWSDKITVIIIILSNSENFPLFFEGSFRNFHLFLKGTRGNFPHFLGVPYKGNIWIFPPIARSALLRGIFPDISESALYGNISPYISECAWVPLPEGLAYLLLYLRVMHLPKQNINILLSTQPHCLVFCGTKLAHNLSYQL